MSMPNWLNDVHPFPNNDNGAFNPAGDPSMAFMQTPATSSFEFNHLQNQQLQQRMQNGNTRNGSPAYHNPLYPTQPLIPSKRSRPRDDSIGESPRQIPGALPASRSQTPQGVYPGYQGAINGNQQFPGTPSYQQFQQASSNPSQSPVVSNQSFNPQAAQQRVQTMSPSPFSPVTQNFGGAHVSPPQSEHGSRVNTPQNGGQHYAQVMPYGGAPGQSFTPPIGPTMNGAALSQYNQQSQNHQQQQLRMQQDALRMRQLQQLRQQGGALNPLAQPSNHMSAGQIAALRAQQGPPRPDNQVQLLQAITQFMQQQQLQFIDRPFIAGRQTNSVQLFVNVAKMGGSKRVDTAGQWPKIAQLLGVATEQCMSAGRELQNYWHANLSPYETYMQTQQQQRQATADQARVSNHNQGGDGNARQQAFSPTKQMLNQQGQQLMQPPSHMHAQYQTPQRHMVTTAHEARPALPNGYLTPQQGQAQGRPSSVYSMPQLGMQATPRTGHPKEAQKPSTVAKKDADDNRIPQISGNKNWRLEPKMANLDEHKIFEATSLDTGDTPPTYGGVELAPASNFVGTVDDLLKYKFSVPKVDELGVIDVRALTLSLRSGIHGEVRLALDTLASLTIEQNPLHLDSCEDLLEALIDCAEDQVDLLADHAAEVSDAMLISSYEEIARGCKIENAILQDVPEVGTLEHDLDRAVNRLICVTTILRNFSFLELNHTALVDPMVVRFMTTVIRYLGTRTMLLRTNLNSLDFSKDVLTFLTNVSQRIDLPGKEEALCILHFLLSFAPSPTPHSTEDEDLSFSSYVPAVHRYFPHAVDSLAKLLARGDPNRSFYRSIFAADSASAPPYDLLTRAFGLAIAAIPEYGHVNTAGLVKLRAPHLVQGLLAAEIIVSLIPASEHELAYTWLTSRDGFIFSLTRMVSEFSRQPQPSFQQRHVSGRVQDNDPHGIITITNRGLAVLRKLAEKAKDAFGSAKGLPPEVMPDKRSVLSALVQANTGDVTVAMLCGLSSLDA
ncbi:MAG: hypothetical protein ASARMPRED_008092 [Alectoria sarmentosa]|nr:MAG: hypothetical protein ASARMPRED_008092 [Alectoria sarmentosa]